MKLKGWVCFISAITSIPIQLLVWHFSDKAPQLRIISYVLTIISVALFFFIYQSLRKLLTEKFKFFDVDGLLTFLIWFNIIYTLIGIAVPVDKLISLLFMILQGIIWTSIGIKLLRLKYQFGGLWKPFCITLIVTGISMASVFLIVIAMVIAVANDVILGLIFFHAADRANDHQ